MCCIYDNGSRIYRWQCQYSFFVYKVLSSVNFAQFLISHVRSGFAMRPNGRSKADDNCSAYTKSERSFFRYYDLTLSDFELTALDTYQNPECRVISEMDNEDIYRLGFGDARLLTYTIALIRREWILG